jgi:hypothetical protein
MEARASRRPEEMRTERMRALYWVKTFVRRSGSGWMSALSEERYARGRPKTIVSLRQGAGLLVSRLPARKFCAQLPIRMFNTSNHRSRRTSRMTELLTRRASTRDLTPGKEGGWVTGWNGLLSGAGPPELAHKASRPAHEDIIPAMTLALPRRRVASTIEAISSRSEGEGSSTVVKSERTRQRVDDPRSGGSG